MEKYEREHMCEALANMSVGWRDPGWVHDGVMKNLKKGARHYYQVIFLKFFIANLKRVNWVSIV